MRLTQTLHRQHIGQWFKQFWYDRRDIRVNDLKVDAALRQKGIEVDDAFKMIYPNVPFINRARPIKPVLLRPPQEVKVIDETHPLWNTRKCHLFRDTNVLVTGMPQAQVLTKTVCVDGLPQALQTRIDAITITRGTDKNMKNSILAAHLFDAEQKLLEKVKDPLRPAWNFPRSYGITRQRKNRLIVAKLLHECEKLAGLSLSTQRKLLSNALSVVPFEKNGDLYQFEVTTEMLMTSTQPLPPIGKVSASLVDSELPDIFPLKCNISIPAGHLYVPRNIYPIRSGSRYFYPHTAFLHFSQEVQNLHETPVTQTQFESRAMLKSFALAAASAQSKYGADVKHLPEPITVQSVQINGNIFYFGVFQLNTLDLDGTDGPKNVWYSIPQLKLYEHCDYEAARPRLVNYNPDVLRHTLGFYQNH